MYVVSSRRSRKQRRTIAKQSLLPQKKKWFEERNINVHETDYDEASVIAILDSSNATVLISFIQLVDSSYVDIHRSLVNACVKSKACKRIIPSEWVGNLDDFPMKPTFYGISREPIRKMLRETSSLQWTLFNQGFFMDYFLPASKTYMKPIPDEFPVDPNGWKVCIRGTGDEPIAFTTVREVAKAVVELLTASEWVCAEFWPPGRVDTPRADFVVGAYNICCWRMDYVQ